MNFVEQQQEILKQSQDLMDATEERVHNVYFMMSYAPWRSEPLVLCFRLFVYYFLKIQILCREYTITILKLCPKFL